MFRLNLLPFGTLFVVVVNLAILRRVFLGVGVICSHRSSRTSTAVGAHSRTRHVSADYVASRGEKAGGRPEHREMRGEVKMERLAES
jgi:hypothetical protein